jgi:oxygen-independent coproporphyrinogen III oxidase
MHYPASELVIDPLLIRKYDVGGPRCTSYPAAERFVEAFGEPQLRQALARRNIGGFSQPLSLCVRRVRSAKYIQYLEKELALLAPLLGEDLALHEMHWAGGAPDSLAREELAALVHAIEARLPPAPRAQYSIDIDPRGAEPGLMAVLGDLGFDRVCLGVQSIEATRRVMEDARASGFRSVNLNLVYGLPRQSLDSFNRVLDEVLRLAPDRVALHGHEAAPPAAELKLELMTLAVGRLTRAGYLYLGMDHFARPDDELAAAQARGQLGRGLQGYSTRAGDLLGVGVSVVGQIGPSYYQNTKDLDRYYAALDAGRLPVLRGVDLTADDLVRRAVIQALMCHFRLSTESIELAHLIDFRTYFAEELKEMRRLADDGLVEIEPNWIVVTPRGRLLVRAICMLFDRYLREARERASYSKIM